MNKYRFMSLAALGAAMFAGVAFTSCSDDDTDSITGGLSVQAVSPTKVMEGQEVTLTGTGLENVTAVVFPGGVKATDIKKVGNGLISVITPAGISADGGEISVEANGETATARMQLTVGHPVINTVAPLNEEILINGYLQVYGTDLEFIAKAIFPGADGGEVVANAVEFRRKSTSAVFIYVPMGIQAGPAAVKLVDVAGNIYTLPEVTLSDKVLGGSEAALRDKATIWEGDYSGSWTFLEMNAGDLNFNGSTPKVGDKLKFYFENAVDDSRFCICLGDGWVAPDLGGESDKNNVSIANAKEYVVTITDQFLPELTGGIMRIGGVNFNLKKVEYCPVQTIWTGDYNGSWAFLEMNAGDLNFDDIAVKKDAYLTFVLENTADDSRFCICLGDGWVAPDLGGESDKNNVSIANAKEFKVLVTDQFVTELTGGIMRIGGVNFNLKEVIFEY